jgi:hypothetical protein
MKTRLMWLGLLCLALLLALGLLVVSAEELPPPPAQAQYLLPPSAIILDSQGAVDIGRYRSPLVSLPASLSIVSRILSQTLSSDANGIPLNGGSYTDAAYTAFHFSDEAG